jgi:hypothetical protein
MAASFISGQTNSGSSRRRTSGQRAGLDHADRVDRDARRHRQGEAVRLRPTVTGSILLSIFLLSIF